MPTRVQNCGAPASVSSIAAPHVKRRNLPAEKPETGLSCHWCSASPIWVRLFPHWTRRASARAFCTCGERIPMSVEMIEECATLRTPVVLNAAPAPVDRSGPYGPLLAGGLTRTTTPSKPEPRLWCQVAEATIVRPSAARLRSVSLGGLWPTDFPFTCAITIEPA